MTNIIIKDSRVFVFRDTLLILNADYSNCSFVVHSNGISIKEFGLNRIDKAEMLFEDGIQVQGVDTTREKFMHDLAGYPYEDNEGNEGNEDPTINEGGEDPTINEGGEDPTINEGGEDPTINEGGEDTGGGF